MTEIGFNMPIIPSRAFEGLFVSKIVDFTRRSSPGDRGDYYKVEITDKRWLVASVMHPIAMQNIINQMRMYDPGYGYSGFPEVLNFAVVQKIDFIIRRRCQLQHGDGEPMWAYSVVDPFDLAMRKPKGE